MVREPLYLKSSIPQLVDLIHELAYVDRFLIEVHRSISHRLHCVLDGGVSAYDDHCGFGGDLLELSQQFNTTELWHPDVQ